MKPEEIRALETRVAELEAEIAANRRHRSRARAWVVRGAFLAVAILPAVSEAVDPPAGVLPFVTGESIRADDVTNAFTTLYEAVTDLENARPIYENPDTGERYSTLASPCGDTQTSTANLGGPAAVKTLCEAQCGSDTAHACRTQEVLRFVETGGVVETTGWVNNDFAEYQIDNVAFRRIANCDGWTATSGADQGARWDAGEVHAVRANCTDTSPVLCCD